MTTAQENKLKEIEKKAEELLNTNVNGLNVLRETISISAPSFFQFQMTNRPPSVEQLEFITARLLAIILASTK